MKSFAVDNLSAVSVPSQAARRRGRSLTAPRALIALVAAIALLGCKEPPAPPAGPPPLMSLAEVKRGQEACKTYADKLCACSARIPTLQEKCGLARALPDALQLSVETAEATDTKRLDSLQASSSASSIVKECFEQLAKLPRECQ